VAIQASQTQACTRSVALIVMGVKSSQFVRDGSQGRIGSLVVTVSVLKAVASAQGVSCIEIDDEGHYKTASTRKGKATKDGGHNSVGRKLYRTSVPERRCGFVPVGVFCVTA